MEEARSSRGEHEFCAGHPSTHMHHRSHARPATHVACLCFSGWRTAGYKRHMAVDFGNAKCKSARSAKLASTNEACRRAGLKLANTRRWKTREPKAMYDALAESDESVPQSPQQPRPSAGADKGEKAGSSAAAWLKSSAFALLKVGSINIRGGLLAKLGELDEFLSKRKYGVVTLQDIRHRKGDEKKIIVKGYKADYQDLGFQSGPRVRRGDHPRGRSPRCVRVFASKVRCTEKDQLWVRISSTGERRPPALLCVHAARVRAKNSERGRLQVS